MKSPLCPGGLGIGIPIYGNDALAVQTLTASLVLPMISTLVIQEFSPVGIFVAVSPPKKYLSNVTQCNDCEFHKVLRYRDDTLISRVHDRVWYSCVLKPRRAETE